MRRGREFKTRSGDVVRLADPLDEAVERMHKGMVARNEEAAAAKAEVAAAADGMRRRRCRRAAG